MKVLIVGAGMYVCGKNSDGLGTILPVLAQMHKRGEVKEVAVAATSAGSIDLLNSKLEKINKLLNSNLKIDGYPKAGTDTNSYQDAADNFKPDCAIISTPDDTHTEIAQSLMSKGIHLLVVKPLAPTRKEVESLIASKKENNIYGLVEFHKRFDRSNLKLRESIQMGEVGSPLYFIIEYSQRKIIPTKVFKSWVDSVNIFQYLGIHYVDIISFATKAKPARAMAVSQNTFLKSQSIQTPDAITATIEWEMTNGEKFTSSFHVNWIDPENTSAMSDQRIKVIGTKGRFEADQKYRGIRKVSDEKAFEEINPDFCQFYLNPDETWSIRGYGVESVEGFVKDTELLISGAKSIKDLEVGKPTFEEAKISTAVVEAVNESLKRENSWVEIRDL